MGADLLQQGLNLMLFGMGTVFVFLALLVIGTTLMSSIVTKYFPEPIVEEINRPPSNTLNSAISGVSPVDTKTLRIIQEAINLHRSKK